MNTQISCTPQGTAERWSRICSLVADATRARRDGVGVRDSHEEIAEVWVKWTRATDDLVSELDHLAQQGVLDAIGTGLDLIYRREEGK
ncbi:MAG: hypothetical protein JJU24_05240 [Natronohydrobacter sp.]|nr:hypothetical protein [Natronohydrobacter sp.]